MHFKGFFLKLTQPFFLFLLFLGQFFLTFLELEIRFCHGVSPLVGCRIKKDADGGQKNLSRQNWWLDAGNH
jgi:hypothetical protein